MRTLRTAIIGTGFIGPAHIEALRRIGGVDIAVVCSKDPDRARDIASKTGTARVTTSWIDAVNDPGVDVVHNCTPNDLHYEINKAAIIAGKHVVSEKPLTIRTRESAHLVQLVKKHGVVNAVNFNYRFYPLIQQAKEMVRKGEVGDVRLVHGHYLQDWLYYKTDYNWRLESRVSGPSRAVADIGSHWFDLAQFVLGASITHVFADLMTVHAERIRPRNAVATFKGKETKTRVGGQRFHVDTEDAGVVVVRFDNGARGSLVVSQVSAGRKNREWFEIDGSQRSLAWDQEEPNSLWIGHRDKPNEIMIKDPALLHSDARKYAHYPGGHPEGYPDGPKNLFMNVYDFIRSGKDPRKGLMEFPTFMDGHRENLIVEAVLKSNKKQTWVRV